MGTFNGKVSPCPTSFQIKYIPWGGKKRDRGTYAENERRDLINVETTGNHEFEPSDVFSISRIYSNSSIECQRVGRIKEREEPCQKKKNTTSCKIAISPPHQHSVSPFTFLQKLRFPTPCNLMVTQQDINKKYWWGKRWYWTAISVLSRPQVKNCFSPRLLVSYQTFKFRPFWRGQDLHNACLRIDPSLQVVIVTVVSFRAVTRFLCRFL